MRERRDELVADAHFLLMKEKMLTQGRRSCAVAGLAVSVDEVTGNAVRMEFLGLAGQAGHKAGNRRNYLDVIWTPATIEPWLGDQKTAESYRE